MTGYLSVLPHLNACLNATSALFLLTGYYFIKRLKVRAHRNCQISALVASTVFLISYLTYHYHHGATRLCRAGNRAAYLFHHFDYAHDSRRRNSSSDHRHCVPGRARRLFPAPQNSPLDLPALALCFGDRGRRILDALSCLPVNLEFPPEMVPPVNSPQIMGARWIWQSPRAGARPCRWRS